MADAGPPPGTDLTADQGGRIVSSMTALIVLPTIFVILRLVSRRIARAGFWWDDFWVLIALALSYGPCICVLVSKTSNGFGKRIWVLGPGNTSEFLKILYVYQIFYFSAVSAVKFCIIAFYHRIFNVKELKLILFLAASVVLCYYLGSILATLFQCTPVNYLWDKNIIPAGHCANGDPILIVPGSINCLLDLLIIVLPIPLLWRLRTTVSQKGVLTGIFVCAGFVLIISIIRLVVIGHLAIGDYTWTYVDSAIWTAAEPSMGVISACVPSLRPLVSLCIRGTVRGLGVSKISANASGKSAQGMNSSTSGRFAGWRSHTDPDDASEDRDNLTSTTTTARLEDGPVSDPNSKRWGHEVEVIGGRRGSGYEDGISLEEMNIPFGTIQVKDEVDVVSSDWLEYQDRVF